MKTCDVTWRRSAAVATLMLLSLACGKTTPFDDGDAGVLPPPPPHSSAPDAATNLPDAQVSGCADDDFEENDDLASAAFYWRGIPGDFVSCPDDVDVLQHHSDCCFDSHGVLVGATVEWDPADGDLEVEIFDADGNPVPLDNRDEVTDAPGLAIRRHAQLSGRFNVKVVSLSGTRVPYRVTFHKFHYL